MDIVVVEKHQQQQQTSFLGREHYATSSAMFSILNASVLTLVANLWGVCFADENWLGRRRWIGTYSESTGRSTLTSVGVFVVHAFHRVLHLDMHIPSSHPFR